MFSRLLSTACLALLSVLSASGAEPASGPAGRVDLYGDPLPAGVRTRLGTVRFRHEGVVECVAFAPDGKTLIAGDSHNLVRVWEVPTGKPLRILRGHRAAVRSVMFAADGKSVISIDASGAIRQWDAATGKQLRAWDGTRHHGQRIVSPDLKTVAATEHGLHGDQLKVSDLSDGKNTRNLDVTGRLVRTFTFSPDGKTLAVASGSDAIALWDVASGRRLHLLKGTGHHFPFMRLAFSPDGKTLVGPGKDYTVGVWDVATGKQLAAWQTALAGAGLNSATFAPDGKHLACCEESGLVVRDAATGKVLRTWDFFIFGVVFSPDGKTLATSFRTQQIVLWDVATGRELPHAEGHRQGVVTIAFSPDGTTVAAAGGWLRRWDAATGKPIGPALGDNLGDDVRSVSFSPDGKVLAAGGWTSGEFPPITLRDAAGKPIRRLGAKEPEVQALAFSPDGKTLAEGGDDPSVRLWDPMTGKLLGKLAGHEGRVRSVAFSPEGKCLASADDKGVVRLWSLSERKEVGQLTGHNDAVNAVTFAPDGETLATAGADGTVRLWRRDSRREVLRMTGTENPVRSVAFSPDGRVLAAAWEDDRDCSGTVQLWEVATGREVRRLEGHRGTVNAVAFSPEGRTLASGGADTTVLLWDVPLALAGTPPGSADLTPREVKQLWDDLASPAAHAGQRAVWRLAQSPRQAVPRIRDGLAPTDPAESRQVQRLIRNLASDQFTVRQRAADELEKRQGLAEPPLRELLAGHPPLDLRRRAEAILAKLEGPIVVPEVLRAVRAVQVLEYARTPDARDVLRRLARGTPDSRLTREAKAALGRLEPRPARMR